MTIHSVPLRHQPATERRVLATLHGDDHLDIKPLDVRRRRQKRRRCRSRKAVLRRTAPVAARDGIVVQIPGSPYVSNGELMVMAWLAEAQRITGRSGTMPVDPPFVVAIARCAGLLDALGLHLSPMALYGARRRSATPSTDNDTSEQPGATRRIAETIA